MPRAKAYDGEALLDEALHVFWRQGYVATSFADIVQATGVNRFSLYEAHESKHGLFLACLDRYHATVVSTWLQSLERPGAALPELRAFFAAMASHTLDGPGPAGCLTCNTAMEVGAGDAGIAARIYTYVCRMTAAFGRAIETASERGELPAGDAGALASYLMGVVFGFFLYARTPAPRALVESYLAQALRPLGGGAGS